jgi:hypothetical protein
VGKHKEAVSVANSDGAVQCMGARENEELERQEGQTDSAVKGRGKGLCAHMSLKALFVACVLCLVVKCACLTFLTARVFEIDRISFLTSL